MRTGPTPAAPPVAPPRAAAGATPRAIDGTGAPATRTSTAPAAGSAPTTSPDWVKDAVFYQVFPDRFRNGDPGNDPAGTEPWGAPPKNDTFFQGGDLQGVQQGLPHLQRLGVNALYFNPIFASPSNHKYDTTDYANVDAAFGGNAAFTGLVDAAHAGGMKVMLDAVLNHTSNEHSWFRDVRERGPQSPYWSWYTVNRFPISTWRDDKGVLRSNDYKGWGKPEWGGPYATLPVLRSDNPEVMREMVTGEESVIKRWVRDAKVDGWRFDVADEMPESVWRTARQELKSLSPDVAMIAENWQDATSMLRGDQFDGAMNYKYFQQPAVEFFAQKRINADQFVERLRNGYSLDKRLSMFNHLESHDTPRFITQAGGDWYRARPAAIFQMTFQGAPSIYYGGEIGMEGGADPDSRRAFEWDVADRVAAPAKLEGTQVRGAASQVGRQARANQLFGLYQRLIETRKGVDALRRGEFEVIKTHNDKRVLAYRRFLEGDAKDAIVAINNDTTHHDVTVPVGAFVADGATYRDALTGRAHTVADGSLALGPMDGNWGAVLVRDA
jgi:glycosidase